MFRRVGLRICKQCNDRYFGTTPIRGKPSCEENATSVYSTGGLEKFQGCLKEEKYFCFVNGVLMDKVRQQGDTLTCENHSGNWTEFYKTMNHTDVKTAHREFGSLNRHKNCQEEAFFLNEQNDKVKFLQSKDMDISSLSEKH